MLMNWLWTLLAYTLIRCHATNLPETVQVQLNQGNLEGTKQKIDDSRFFYSFRGIPYAAPPVEDLRFKDPAPAFTWTGVRKGFDPPICPQYDFYGEEFEIMGEEDCLYLHVYTPNPTSKNLPVMVFIHGGGYIFGNTEFYGGSPKYLLKEDIILVSMQYRLGTLGFLSTGDSVLPGNLGLKDQTYALQWVHDNIHKFGGDKDEVTLFGESAGSTSTHLQILTPYNKGFFKRAIMQSGSALNPWAIRDDHAERALKVARYFKCVSDDEPLSTIDSAKLLECFKAQSIKELVFSSTLDTDSGMPFYTAPRIDGDYIPAHPATLLKEGRYNKVEIMSGVCQHEGIGYVIPHAETDEKMLNFVDEFDRKGPIVTYLDNEENSVYLSKRAFYHYAGDTKITKENIESVIELAGDSMFNVGHDEAMILHSRDRVFGKESYRYELQFRSNISSISFYKGWEEFTSKNYVPHAEDTRFLFNNLTGLPDTENSADCLVRDIMVKLWTNFAKTGNPTPDLSLGFKWEPMNSGNDLRFLSIKPASHMKEDNRAHIRDFWRDMPLKSNKILFPEGASSFSQN